uniref:DNA-directed RNA polymerase II subunit RPB7 n=1 Tax=Coccolithus braarudii TaxID=221442 RepID=A0A7S0Q1B7_9EUKA|mmetsp:Transcript_22593/g.48780  ORF Transcript_22593/g.48780 Transcript_22593/m.48780 type:complete len:176 (+) Transcript_22593:231-758(+)
MFFHIPMERELLLYPNHFGPNVHELLVKKLIAKVEGSCSGRHGFVICVTDIQTTGAGRIREGAGLATFAMKFNAIVFRPFKGQVLDAIVTTVNKMGFFAEVGPLQVFVSKHQTPRGMEYDAQSNPVSYVQHNVDEQPIRVTKDSEVRLRVIGTHFESTEIRAIGTIKENYLGLIA